MCHACPTNEPKVPYVKPPPPKHEKLKVNHECFTARKSRGYIRDPIIKKTIYVCESKPSLTKIEKKFHVKPYIKCYEVPEGLLGQMDTEGTNITPPANMMNQSQFTGCPADDAIPNGWYPNFDPFANSQPLDYPNCPPEGQMARYQTTQNQVSAPKTKVQMIKWKEFKEPPPPPAYRVTKIVKEVKKEIPDDAECYNPIPIYCVHNNPMLAKILEERTKPNGPSNGPLPRFNPKYLCEKPEPIGKVIAHEYQKEWLCERDELREQYYPSNPCPPLNIKFVPCPSIERSAKDKIIKRRVDPKPWYINFNIGHREKDGRYFWLLKPCTSDCGGNVKPCFRKHKY